MANNDTTTQAPKRTRTAKRGFYFEHDRIYIHDDGTCACGAHVGTEATYMPQQWSDLGIGKEYIYQGVTFRCEMCRYSEAREGASA